MKILRRVKIADGSFYRLPKSVIGNDFWAVVNKIKRIYDQVESGQDYKPEDMKSVISVLQKFINRPASFQTKEKFRAIIVGNC